MHTLDQRVQYRLTTGQISRLEELLQRLSPDAKELLTEYISAVIEAFLDDEKE